jgi:iron complex transport system substrate-binding protein
MDADPVALIAGWAAPQRIDRGVFEAYRKRFPGIDHIATVGGVVPETSSAEAILSVSPDLFVVSNWDRGWGEIVAILEAANIPVIFLDGPLNDGKGQAEVTTLSVALLAQAIGRKSEGQAFADFLTSRYSRIANRAISLRPVSVLVDAQADGNCCSSPGKNNSITSLLEMAGGTSIAANIPGYIAQLNPEYVISADPNVYIATGGPHLAASHGLVLGGGVSLTRAGTSFEAILKQQPRMALNAVNRGRAHAVSHQLAISVLNILALECFAKWLHPEIYADVDPVETLQEINRRFMAVPLEGTFWIDAPIEKSAR